MFFVIFVHPNKKTQINARHAACFAVQNYPLSQVEALKLIERLVWRAASLKKHMDGALIAASVQVSLDLDIRLILI